MSTIPTARPGWLPPDDELRRFFGKSILYPYYRLRLVEYIARLLPSSGHCTILDVGAGDGSLGVALEVFRPQTRVLGLEVQVREATRSGSRSVRFDGRRIPLRDGSFDIALLSNVLHHAVEPRALLQEVRRVTRSRVIIKDHLTRGRLDDLLLTALDVLGNLRFGAQVSATYLGVNEWVDLFHSVPEARVTRFDDLSFRRGVLEIVFPNRLELIFTLELKGAATV